MEGRRRKAKKKEKEEEKEEEGFYIGIIQESWTNSTRLSDRQCDMGELNLRMITMNKTACKGKALEGKWICTGYCIIVPAN
ncbi:hypothetical protein T01_7334 [Trichinella spiralis]|uniref:Uncharacterized protein n=1 Tax=Trichinella spiralis TaxID=6334 RepID=A0A0V1AMR7_TRISP|nr:hypothetical protein T01_1809 [Trichinella spiralis]KRY26123.1 hypothetical protein T01_7334 [Trichinella spiralis]